MDDALLSGGLAPLLIEIGVDPSICNVEDFILALSNRQVAKKE